jgi:hypothetical protein
VAWRPPSEINRERWKSVDYELHYIEKHRERASILRAKLEALEAAMRGGPGWRERVSWSAMCGNYEEHVPQSVEHEAVERIEKVIDTLVAWCLLRLGCDSGPEAREDCRVSSISQLSIAMIVALALSLIRYYASTS